MTEKYVSPVTQMIPKNGKAVRMVAGLPRTLPEDLVPVALARGVKLYGDKPATEASPKAEDRVPQVVEAIKALIASGDPKAFSERTGEPNLTALRKQAGFQVTDAERDAAWEQVKNEE